MVIALAVIAVVVRSRREEEWIATGIVEAGPVIEGSVAAAPKSFQLDKARSKELRSWITTTQKPTETKHLRENFHPSFEKSTFDLKVPTLDPSMARRLKEVRGGEASKAETKEKALVASQFKILDIAKPLLYLWGSASAASDPLLISAAESALQLWGHAFHSITTQRRKNVSPDGSPFQGFVGGTGPVQGKGLWSPLRPHFAPWHGQRCIRLPEVKIAGTNREPSTCVLF